MNENDGFEYLSFRRRPNRNGYDSADKKLEELFSLSVEMAKDMEKKTHVAIIEYCEGSKIAEYAKGHLQEVDPALQKHPFPEDVGDGPKLYSRIAFETSEGSLYADISAYVTIFLDDHGCLSKKRIGGAIPKVERHFDLILPKSYTSSEKFLLKKRKLTRSILLGGMGYKEADLGKV